MLTSAPEQLNANKNTSSLKTTDIPPVARKKISSHFSRAAMLSLVVSKANRWIKYFPNWFCDLQYHTAKKKWCLSNYNNFRALSCLKGTKDGLADNIYFKTCFNSLAARQTYSSCQCCRRQSQRAKDQVDTIHDRHAVP